MLFLFLSLGWILVTKNSLGWKERHPFVAEHIPPSTRNDSVMFLRAACFLDPNFQERAFKPLVPAERDIIGLEIKKTKSRETIVFLLLVGLSGICVILQAVWYGVRHWKSLEKLPHSIFGVNATLLCLVPWIFCSFILIASTKNIYELRSWADRSGWLQLEETGNPENSVNGYGQMLTIASAFAILIPLLENIPKKHNNEYRSSPYYQLR